MGSARQSGASALGFGSRCTGPQPPKSTRLTFVVEVVSTPTRRRTPEDEPDHRIPGQDDPRKGVYGVTTGIPQENLETPLSSKIRRFGERPPTGHC